MRLSFFEGSQVKHLKKMADYGTGPFVHAGSPDEYYYECTPDVSWMRRRQARKAPFYELPTTKKEKWYYLVRLSNSMWISLQNMLEKIFVLHVTTIMAYFASLVIIAKGVGHYYKKKKFCEQRKSNISLKLVQVGLVVYLVFSKRQEDSCEKSELIQFSLRKQLIQRMKVEVHSYCITLGCRLESAFRSVNSLNEISFLSLLRRLHWKTSAEYLLYLITSSVVSTKLWGDRNRINI